MAVAVTGASLGMVVVLAVVVQRARKILDFGLTYLVVHLVFSCLIGGFPGTWSWWGIHGVGGTVAIVLGELLSMRMEMAEIKIEKILGDKDPKRKMYQDLQRLRKIKV